MEVHAHTHTPRKKWTHYLWEFLMLFLAVFCGFLAENQREHMIEHQRAKVLAASLYQDLRNDTTDLNRINKWEINKLNHIDSLLAILHKKLPRNDTAFSIHLATMAFVNWFYQNKGTYEQMKNSGTLRYFDQPLINMLQNYENILSEVRLREEAESKKLEQRIIPFVEETINYEFLYALLSNNPLPYRVYVNLAGSKQEDLLSNQAFEIKVIGMRRSILYKQLKELATEILKKLKKDYKISSLWKYMHTLIRHEKNGPIISGNF